MTPVVKPQVRPVDLATAQRLDGDWIAVIGEDRPFRFSGEYRSSELKNGYQMLYPAPDFATFLVGIATHAAIQSAESEAHEEAQRRASDVVLAPYEQVLDEILVHGMFKHAVQLQNSSAEIDVVATTAGGAETPVIELAAHAIMAQSRRALIVDLVARVQNPSITGDDSGYVHKVRVISNPIGVEERRVDSYWVEDEGRQLKQTVSRLLAQAIDLFIADATQHLQPLEDKQITARYQFGSERRIERASLLQQSCARMTLRTLRGWVLSVPVLDSLKRNTGCMDTEVVSHREVPSV
ncbi:MAG: hypothetical protein ABW096_06990 [Candidatus Thiodiazotropha sp.]